MVWKMLDDTIEEPFGKPIILRISIIALVKTNAVWVFGKIIKTI